MSEARDALARCKFIYEQLEAAVEAQEAGEGGHAMAHKALEAMDELRRRSMPNLDKLDIDQWINEAQAMMDKVGLKPSSFEMVIMGYLCRICKELSVIQKKLDAEMIARIPTMQDREETEQ